MLLCLLRTDSDIVWSASLLPVSGAGGVVGGLDGRDQYYKISLSLGAAPTTTPTSTGTQSQPGVLTPTPSSSYHHLQ